MRKVWKLAGAVAGLMGLWAGQASAVSAPNYDIPYAGITWNYEIGDSARDSENGQGYQLIYGVPLSYDKTALEITFSDIGRTRNIDGNKDYQTLLMADLVHDFGLFGWDTQWLPKFKPFVLAGLGAIQEDVRGDRHIHFGGELGAGLLLPTNFHGWALRADARVMGQSNDQSAAGEDMLIDYRVTAGLQIPLSYFYGEKAAVAPGADCELAVVDVSSGRRDCAADTDHDGVADSIDQCPGTPLSTIVDTKGCPTGAGQVLATVEFKTASAELTDASKARLDGVAAKIKAIEDSSVTIEVGGHTDSVGNEPYNLMLSEQRAEAVRQYLISQGVAEKVLSAHGYGKVQPLGDNSTADGRQENRRVEFKIVVN